MEKLYCKYCNHLQKINNKESKCSVCLKKGFMDDTNDINKNNTQQVPQDNINNI